MIFIIILSIFSMLSSLGSHTNQPNMHIIQVPDLSGSLQDHLYIRRHHVGQAINFIQNNGGGKYSLVLINDGMPLVKRLLIPTKKSPFSKAKTQFDELAQRSQHEQEQQRFLKRQARFMEFVDANLDKRYSGTDLENAFQAVNTLLKEPFDVKHLIVLSDGLQDAPSVPGECAQTKIDRGAKVFVVGWQNTLCPPTLGYYETFYDVESIFEHLRISTSQSN